MEDKGNSFGNHRFLFVDILYLYFTNILFRIGRPAGRHFISHRGLDKSRAENDFFTPMPFLGLSVVTDKLVLAAHAVSSKFSARLLCAGDFVSHFGLLLSSSYSRVRRLVTSGNACVSRSCTRRSSATLFRALGPNRQNTSRVSLPRPPTSVLWRGPQPLFLGSLYPTDKEAPLACPRLCLLWARDIVLSAAPCVKHEEGMRLVSGARPAT